MALANIHRYHGRRVYECSWQYLFRPSKVKSFVLMLIDMMANCYLQTEAPLLIRPLLPKMTKSELHAVMTGGFATIAGL